MTAPGRYFAISDAERSLICLRLVIEALAEREKYSDSETDWESLYHMAEVSTGLVQALDQMRQDAWQETDGARAEAKRLQQQLDALQQENNVLQQQLAKAQAPAMAQQSEEIAYLRARLDEERSVSAGLRQQLDAAQAAVTLQRTRIERQRRVVDKVRQMLFKPNRDIEYGDINGLRAAIAELDAQPATVAETAEGGT